MKQDGFTLIEVLIAMAVTALIAAASYSGISTVLTSSEQLRAGGERTRAIGRALRLIERDLRQLVNRPVRDEFGAWQPALSGGPLALYPLSVTRAGWFNTLQRPRSDLQRVHYYLDDGALWRAYNTTLDRAVDVNMQRVLLLQDVEAIEFRFLDNLANLQVDRDLVIDTRGWTRNWVLEPGTGAGPGALPPMPAALELRLELADLGELRSLYELPEQ